MLSSGFDALAFVTRKKLVIPSVRVKKICCDHRVQEYEIRPRGDGEVVEEVKFWLFGQKIRKERKILSWRIHV